MFLAKLKIGIRLQLIVASALIGIGVVAALTLNSLHSNLMNDRKDKTEDLVNAAFGIIEHFAAREKAGELPREAAQTAAKKALKDLRYDGDNYFWLQHYDLTAIMHPIKPELEGQSLAGAKDAAGNPFYAEMQSIVTTKGAGFVNYVWQKPGEKEPSPKVSYVKGYAPWKWFVASGIYVDDVDAIFYDIALVIGGVVLLIALVVGGGSLVIARGITGPIGGIARDMLKIADGDKSVAVKNTELKNEIGDLSRAMKTFLEKTIEMDRMREAQEEQERKAAAERKALLNQMASDFEASVGTVVSQVASASSQMNGSAAAMSAAAEETSRQSTAVAAASEQASTNVQTVATAADELTASISEIGRQIAQASSIAGGAVRQAEDANDKVQSLSQAAQKIGEVVSLINDIASQTNLLALNATIEAARAGEAGKGFAVVASEVKNLATQTAKATGDIAAQIDGVQASTREAVEAIAAITRTVGDIDKISSAIAAAVEEQSAATQEIARNIEQAAVGTTEVNNNITGVSKAANDTGSAAVQIRAAATSLAEQSEALRDEVNKFLTTVRAA
jgi:methyl-accepting chemotaxis protein